MHLVVVKEFGQVVRERVVYDDDDVELFVGEVLGVFDRVCECVV